MGLLSQRTNTALSHLDPVDFKLKTHHLKLTKSHVKRQCPCELLSLPARTIHLSAVAMETRKLRRETLRPRVSLSVVRLSVSCVRACLPEWLSGLSINPRPRPFCVSEEDDWTMMMMMMMIFCFVVCLFFLERCNTPPFWPFLILVLFDVSEYVFFSSLNLLNVIFYCLLLFVMKI